MENRNVKTIDEHGIDRDARVICGFIVDQKKYALYSIGRDDESDNIFVSGLVDNNDKTSNMINIDDNMERTKVNEIARDLVTYSLRDEGDKSKEEVELPGNNKVKIVDVSFNKEQNINVTKTYIATVKKSVSKVSEDFYNIDKQKDDLEKTTVFETLPSEEIVKEPTLVQPEMVMPEIKPVEEPLPAVPEPVQEEVVSVTSPVVTPELIAEEKKVQKEVEQLSAVENASEPVSTVTVSEPKPEVEVPSFAVPPVEQLKEVNQQPELEVPETLLQSTVQVETPQVQPINTSVTMQPEVKQEMTVETKLVEPVTPVIPTTIVPTEPINVEAPSAVEPKLFFDGTNENNLNKALNEVSEEKVVSAPQEGVESLREFGTDNPTASMQEVSSQESVKTLTRSKGFANNKFFMVIAIAFFLAACVFLGYEAFQYFTLK